ncbi:MAG: hypothetical protein SF182_19085 [Deltaproteobacteria bacterium]|nr:hypothetical protein [Deltaproteobacteria bacterium]
MKTLIVSSIAALLVAGSAVAQPSSRALPNSPLNNSTQVASSGTQPCRQELKQQRQDIQRLIDRLEGGEKLDPAQLERALRDANR